MTYFVQCFCPPTHLRGEASRQVGKFTPHPFRGNGTSIYFSLTKLQKCRRGLTSLILSDPCKTLISYARGTRVCGARLTRLSVRDKSEFFRFFVLGGRKGGDKGEAIMILNHEL